MTTDDQVVISETVDSASTDAITELRDACEEAGLTLSLTERVALKQIATRMGPTTAGAVASLISRAYDAGCDRPGSGRLLRGGGCISGSGIIS